MPDQVVSSFSSSAGVPPVGSPATGNIFRFKAEVTPECMQQQASENLPNKHKINALNKGIQKLLWKNRYKFPKATAQIKLLGLKMKETTISLTKMIYIISSKIVRQNEVAKKVENALKSCWL
ncbi:hypothetical protein E2562_005954 [Oryza meyeriana var. granulata]|uniref:Uncharacterized protein n=1 Tax=Oryza meyeriana var. granulata TaxID=110450 RepID=A0A6G1DUQ9_9ORYZ|nr:hypothetical protein E2562_005954 [Oryza meyeriana var. granulata]